MFETLSDRLTQVLSSLRGKGKLSAADIDATLREIRIVLLEADVALPVARQFVNDVRERAASEEVSEALNPAQQIIKIVNEELVTILGGEARRLRFAKVPPTVIMLAGLQGSGKTTLAAKLALWLKEQGNTPLLVAADLQRPNAVQQLQVLGEQAGVPVFAPEPGNGVGDPVAVARQSIDEAKHRLHNVVVIDTAGRLGIDQEMMAQAAAIADATDPDEILFVVDAMIGQDAVTTAQAFLDGVGYDGVVLTKLDGDARGGAALSIAQLTGRPVMFASTGEKLATSTSSTPTGWRPASSTWATSSRSSSRRRRRSTPIRPRPWPTSWCRARASRWRTSSSNWPWSASWGRSATCSGCCPVRGRTKNCSARSATPIWTARRPSSTR